MQSSDGLLAQPALVINQKMKLFELRNEFAILDGNGERIGAVTQVNQSLLTKLLRIFSDADVMRRSPWRSPIPPERPSSTSASRGSASRSR